MKNFFKKNLLFLTLSFFGCNALWAQTSGDLILTHVVFADTIIAGQSNVMSYTLKNVGAGSDTFFNSKIYINYYVDDSTNTPFSYNLIPFKKDSFSLGGISALAHGDSINFTTTLKIDSGSNAQALRLKDNEVIIWPSKTLSDNNFNNNFYRAIFYLESASGIISVKNSTFNIHILPNPTHEKLNVKCDENYLNQPIQISILNLLGQQLFTKIIINNEFEAELNSINVFEKGIYFLKMDINGKSKTMKFEVE